MLTRVPYLSDTYDNMTAVPLNTCQKDYRSSHTC